MFTPITLFLLLWLAIAPAAAADKRVTPMDPKTTLRDKLAALTDTQILQRQDAAVDALPAEAALAGVQGVLLAAPRRVEAAHLGDWSALVLSAGTASRQARVPWHTHAMLVATDVDRGTVFAAPAFGRDPSKSPELPGESDPSQGAAVPRSASPAPAAQAIPPPPEASSAGTAWVNVSTVLSLPRRPMQLALRLVYFDQVSNTVLVQQVGDGAAAGPTPMAEVQAVFARLAAAGQSVHRLPLFARHAATPAAPAEPGIALTLGRSGAPGSPLPLHAALRLEMSRPMTIDPVRLQGQAPAAFVRNGPPKALMRASVLLLRPNYEQPYVIPVEFPVWSERELRAGEAVDAAFSIDLAALLPPAALQAGSQVYVLAGRHIAGPVAVGR